MIHFPINVIKTYCAANCFFFLWTFHKTYISYHLVYVYYTQFPHLCNETEIKCLCNIRTAKLSTKKNLKNWRLFFFFNYLQRRIVYIEFFFGFVCFFKFNSRNILRLNYVFHLKELEWKNWTYENQLICLFVNALLLQFPASYKVIAFCSGMQLSSAQIQLL